MLLLLRHGKTKANAGGGKERLRAADTPLSPEGEQAAQQAAGAASDLPLTAILSSPLTRAKATADIWSQQTGVPVTTDPALRARDMGALEGKPVQAVKAVLDHLATHPSAKPPGGGESVKDFVEARYWPAVKPLIESDKLYGLVGHGSGVKAIELGLSGEPLTKWNKEPVIAPGQFALVTKDGIVPLTHDGQAMDSADAAPRAATHEGATSS